MVQVSWSWDVYARLIRNLLGDPAETAQFLGRILLTHGLLTPCQLLEGLREQEESHRVGGEIRLGEILLQKGYVSLEQLLRALELQHAETEAGANPEEP